MPEFCQAIDVFIGDEKGQTATPNPGCNMVEWEGGGTAYVPRTTWQFEDPSDPTVLYLARFREVNVPTLEQKANGEITSMVKGRLLKVSKDPQVGQISLDAGQGAKLLIVGNSGKCTGMFGLITHEE